MLQLLQKIVWSLFKMFNSVILWSRSSMPISTYCRELKTYIQELPWWPSGKESACQCRGHRFDPWSGKIPHALEHESPCTTTIEPVLQNLGATATELSGCNYLSLPSLEPLFHNVRSHCNEKPVRCNKRLPTPSLATTRESPRSNEDPK